MQTKTHMRSHPQKFPQRCNVFPQPMPVLSVAAWRHIKLSATLPQRWSPRRSWPAGKRCGVAANLGGLARAMRGRKLEFCTLTAAPPPKPSVDAIRGDTLWRFCSNLCEPAPKQALDIDLTDRRMSAKSRISCFQVNGRWQHKSRHSTFKLRGAPLAARLARAKC